MDDIAYMTALQARRDLKYTTEDRFEATRMIMAYAFGKRVQPLAGAFQEQRHQVLEVRDATAA
jgi:hypothetical protein